MAPLSREFSLPSSVFEDDETPTIHNGVTALSSKASASFSFHYEDDRRDDESSTESTPSYKAPLSVSFSERDPLVIRDIVDTDADFVYYEKPNRWYARTDLRRFKEEALHAACMLDVHPSLFEKAHHTAVGLETKTLGGMTRKKTRRLVAQSSVFELQRRQKSSGGGATDPEAIAAAYGNYAMDSRQTALQRAEGLLAEESPFAKAATSHNNNNTTVMMFASNDNEVFVLKSPRENSIARSRTSKRRTRNSLLAEEKATAAGGAGSNGKRNSGLIKKPRRRQRLLSILLGLPDRVGCLTAAQRTRYASTSVQFDASQIMRSATAIEI